MENNKKTKSVLVCGCSKLGAHIAQYYSQKGHDVTVLDVDKVSFRKVRDNFSGSTIVGDATDIDVLRHNGAEKCETIVAVTDRDNTNIFISEMASVIFGTSRIYVRLNDEDMADLITEYNNINILSPFLLCMEEFYKVESGGKDE